MRLIDVYEHDDSYTILYELLNERDPDENISHKEMPSWIEHVAFVESQPYHKWFLIEHHETIVGSIYLTNNSEIGLFLFHKYWNKGYGKWALGQLTKEYPAPFYANINPNNVRSIGFFERHGFKLKQVTLELA